MNLSVQQIGEYARKIGCEVKTGERLSAYTTFKIGGEAELIAVPHDIDELALLRKHCTDAGEIPFILGNGSNLLMPDEGMKGVIIYTGKLCECDSSGESITCGAGLVVSKLCNAALDNSLSGLEFAFGIPGTVGGAVYMNAGAYGGEFCDVVTSCECVDENGQRITLSNEDIGFSYRHSVFSQNNLIVARVHLSLKSGNSDEIRAKMTQLNEQRRAKQPLSLPSAGSAFKRPQGYYAGALIEQCGLKGASVGGAAVSEKHAGFIVNLGGATAADVMALIETIQKKVLAETGVLLEPEIRIAKKQEAL